MKKFFVFIIICFLISQGILTAQDKIWSLEDCIRYAIDNNIQIKQQVLQTRIQKNSLAQAKLNLLPIINGSATHSYSFGRALDQNSYTFYNQTLLTDYFYLGGSTNLFSGLTNYNTIQKNKYELLASEQDLQKIQNNVSLNVALAYLQILLNKELVSATEDQLNISLQQIEKTRSS